MTNIQGYLAAPHLMHHLEPMFNPVDSNGDVITDLHYCYWCKPEFFARLAPGYTLCSKCGIVILTGIEEDPYNEEMNVCEKCADELNAEFGDGND